MMKLILIFLMSVIFLRQTNAQSLSVQELVNVLKMPVTDADEFLLLKGYKFSGKQNIDGLATIVYGYYIGTSQPTTKIIQKAIWDGQKTTQYYVCYITFDADEYLNFRKYIIENNYKRTDKDVSDIANYSDGNLDITFRSQILKGFNSYWITFYPTFDRLMVNDAKEALKMTSHN